MGDALDAALTVIVADREAGAIAATAAIAAGTTASIVTAVAATATAFTITGCPESHATLWQCALAGGCQGDHIPRPWRDDANHGGVG